MKEPINLVAGENALEGIKINNEMWYDARQALKMLKLGTMKDAEKILDTNDFMTQIIQGDKRQKQIPLISLLGLLKLMFEKRAKCY